MACIALRERRVIVARDGGLAKRRLATTGRIRVVPVRDDEPRSQLGQVRRDLNLDGRSGFSRWVCCHESLSQRSRESVEGLIHPHVD